MIAQQEDPLRFLKPRKKQFHLTPTKLTKNKSSINLATQSINNSNVNYSFLNGEVDQKQINHNANIDARRQNNDINQKNFLKAHQMIANQKNNDHPINKYVNTLIQQKNHIKKQLNSQKGLFYNPMKYFSQNVQDYLLSKRQNNMKKVLGAMQNTQISKTYNNNKIKLNKQQLNLIKRNQILSKQKQTKQYFDIQKQQNQKYHYNQKQHYNKKQHQNKKQSIQIENDFIIPLKKNEDFQNMQPNQHTMRLQDYFQVSSRNISQKSQNANKKYNFSDNSDDDQEFIQKIKKNVFQRRTQAQINQPKTQQSKIIGKKMPNNYETNNLKNQVFSQQANHQNSELRSCDVCGRKFNLNSYQRHVKVCEKVFFKKRKQFSSQKQRSKSKKK